MLRAALLSLVTLGVHRVVRTTEAGLQSLGLDRLALPRDQLDRLQAATIADALVLVAFPTLNDNCSRGITFRSLDRAVIGDMLTLKQDVLHVVVHDGYARRRLDRVLCEVLGRRRRARLIH